MGFARGMEAEILLFFFFKKTKDCSGQPGPKDAPFFLGFRQ